MKDKLFLVLFFGFVFINDGISQSKFSYGLNSGLNHFSLRGNNVLENVKPRIGYLFGINIDYKLSSRFDINLNLNFEKKSFQYNSEFEYFYMDNQGMIFEEKYQFETVNNYSYITIPLILKYKMFKGKTFFIGAGAFLSRRINRSAVTEINTNYSQVYNNFPFDRNFPLEHYADNQDYGVSFLVGKLINIDENNQINIQIVNNYGNHDLVSRVSINGLTGIVKTNTLNIILNWKFKI